MSIHKVWWKRAAFLLFLVLIGLFIVLCVCNAVRINRNKISQQVETYSIGETVDIGKNFFVDSSEDPSGYTIRVNSVELVNYEDLLASYGVTAADLCYTEGFPVPQYTYQVKVTISNEDNETGAIMALNYALYNQALKIPVDYYLWGLMDKTFPGEPGFRLQTHSEKDITIPFTPMTLETGINNKEISRRMESGEFYFCISEFPVRKMIKIDPLDAVDENFSIT